jgi:CBS domain-containing protein
MMVENRYRHLPVADDSGAVTGLLDIGKCLNDAIDKLEKSGAKGRNAADKAVQDVLDQASGAQADAVKGLLSNLMSQAFGSQMPILKTLMSNGAGTIVGPDTVLSDAAAVMAEHSHAALVVDDGKLVGIFGFKDMVTRAVAKELPLETTPVSQVMTPAPDFCYSSQTLLEALQVMHDHRFLTLPVCEKDGRVAGVVDVLDVIHGCGGMEGWRSIFGSLDLLEDDMSDVTSVQSGASRNQRAPARPDQSTMEPVKESEERSVITLRPSKPIIASSSDTVLSVVQLLRLKRGAAALLVGDEGGLSGILTDTDVTRRVVSKGVDSAVASVNDVMTKDPQCVNSGDSAMDALSIMVENHFRHLPVVDDSGAIVGLLDIAKCLNDAITKLERAKRKESDVANDVLKNVVGTGAQAAALQALLGDLMAKALGEDKVPTLGTLLAGKPRTTVTPSTSVYDAALVMTEHRKAVLVVDEEDSGKLVGIFGFKDMMSRVVAKELPVDTTQVADVMTSSPDTVTPTTTVLEALQVMHDNKFLTLPVCEEGGAVVGIVDVLDVIYGCGGMEGWRSMFQTSLDVTDDRSVASSHTDNKSMNTRSTTTTKKKKIAVKDDKTVQKLRPTKPVICSTEETVLSVTQAMQRKRAAACLLVDPNGGLAGIFTDHDVNNRMLSKNMDPATTFVHEVMTKAPQFCSTSDPATEAMMAMIQGHFRYLPVVGDNGAVVGVLDIAKCLNDAIEKLEKSQKKGTSGNDMAVQELVSQQGANGAQAAALQKLLSTLMAQAFGKDGIPALRSLLPEIPETIVDPSTSLREVSYLMAEHKKAALVVDNGELIGIFGFKDMMARVVAKELSLDTTMVQDVMTADPESVKPDMTALEALQTMHDNRFLTLPVCEDDGRVAGVVDVLDVIHACGGAEQWREMFAKSMELDDVSDSASASQSRLTATVSKTAKRGVAKLPGTPLSARLPANIPTTLEFDDFDDKSASKLPDDMSASIESFIGTFKVTDTEGRTHKVRCACRSSDLIHAVAAKVHVSPKSLALTFVDDEGDQVAITSDDDVLEAFNQARRQGQKVAKILAVKADARSGGGLEPVVLVGAFLAVAGALAVLFLRPRRR